MAGTRVPWRLFSVHVHNAAVRVRLQSLSGGRCIAFALLETCFMKMGFVAEMFGETRAKISRGAAPENSGRTGERGPETRLGRHEPEVDGVADQLGSALHT
jgi:hypothetical protein